MIDRNESLEAAAKFYEYVISSSRTGVNSPLARQIKQSIRLVFAKDGLQALAAIETKIRNSKGVTPSLVGVPKSETTKKLIEARKARRVSQDQDSALGLADSRQTASMLERQRRVAMRDVPQNELPKSKPELEENENAVAVSTDVGTKPLTATEVRDISKMGAKEIVAQYGGERILATLKAISPGEKFSGSDSQLANRLKAKLTK